MGLYPGGLITGMKNLFQIWWVYNREAYNRRDYNRDFKVVPSFKYTAPDFW